MKFRRGRAVSPIIATLLLIAIAVAASIVVYVFVNSLSGGLTQGGGQQTTERLQMQGYNFQLALGTCSAGQILEIFFENTGSVSTSISAVYFDGTLLTALTAATSATTFANQNYFLVTTSNIPTACVTATPSITFTAAGALAEPVTVGSVGEAVVVFTGAGAPVSGTSHIVKVVSTTGATYVFDVTSGRVG
jgi:flagellin-like protein